MNNNSRPKATRTKEDRRTDERLKELQKRLLDKYTSGTIVRRVHWSGGETQVFELGDGPPLVLVHGGLDQASSWAPIMQRLSQDFHIYAVDRPGHGLADHFDYHGVEVLQHSVTFLEGILDGLGIERIALVGNSLGGRWAIEYAFSQPDRVSHLVLPGLPAGAARELPRQFYEGVKMLRLIQRPLIGALLRYLVAMPSSRERRRKGMEGMVSHPERVSDEILDSGIFNVLRNRLSMLTLVEQVVDDVGMIPEFVLIDRWRDLGVPTTFLWGDKDLFGSPDLGRKAASQVPVGKFVLIPDSGHLPWLDEPDLVAKEIVGAVLVR